LPNGTLKNLWPCERIGFSVGAGEAECFMASSMMEAGALWRRFDESVSAVKYKSYSKKVHTLNLSYPLSDYI
jgi:endo-1,4-beta-D-glucanase Y